MDSSTDGIITKYKLLLSNDETIYIKSYNELCSIFFSKFRPLAFKNYKIIDQILVIQTITLFLYKRLINTNQSEQIIEVRKLYNLIKLNILDLIKNEYELNMINLSDEKFRIKSTEIILKIK